MRLLLVVVVAVCAFACEKQVAGSPESAFRQFNDAVRRHDERAAFALLSASSRSALELQARQVSAALDAGVEPHALAFRTNRRSPALLAVEVKQATDSRAMLNVKLCQQPLDTAGTCPAGQDVQEEVTLVREAERWLIELPALVTP